MILFFSFFFHFVNVNESKTVEKFTNCNLYKNSIFKVNGNRLSSVQNAVPLHSKRFSELLYIY